MDSKTENIRLVLAGLIGGCAALLAYGIFVGIDRYAQDWLDGREAAAIAREANAHHRAYTAAMDAFSAAHEAGDVLAVRQAGHFCIAAADYDAFAAGKPDYAAHRGTLSATLAVCGAIGLPLSEAQWMYGMRATDWIDAANALGLTFIGDDIVRAPNHYADLPPTPSDEPAPERGR